jgi:uncharacterized protein
VSKRLQVVIPDREMLEIQRLARIERITLGEWVRRTLELIFVDSNIPMYLIGTAHPHKTESQILLERLIAASERLVTDAEVLQEILHRYTAIEKRDAIEPALRVLLDITDDIFAVEKRDVLRAAEITQHPTLLSARDAVHTPSWNTTPLDRS